MQHLKWWFARLINHVGMTALWAWLLLLVIALYLIYVFLPAKAMLEQLEQHELGGSNEPQVVYRYTSPADTFFTQIPKIDDVTTSIDSIFDIAKQNRIAIDEVHYKEEVKHGDIALRYTMSFSTVASYPAVKTFVIDTLAALPYLALEKLTFERDEKDPQIISSTIQFNLYLVR